VSPVPTPEGDLRTRTAVALSKAATAKGTRLGLLRFPLADAVLSEVVEPELAHLRDEVTAAHTRNAVLRDKHRKEVDDLRAELVAIGAQRDDAEEERASMVRDLHAAVFDGATSLPDRPLDTVWEYLLGCVRNDRARLSGGNATPKDAAETVDTVALFLMRTKFYGTNPDPRCVAAIANQWQCHLTADEREHWRAWARKLIASGWGSAVATPKSTSKDAAERWEEAVAVLREVGCQGTYCEGPEVEPKDMITCHVCWYLHGLSAVATPDDTPAARPAFTPTQLLSTLPDLPDPTGPLADVEALDDTPAGEDALKAELLAWATVLARGTGTVPAVDVAWKLRQLASPAGDAALLAEVDRRVAADTGARHDLADVVQGLREDAEDRETADAIRPERQWQPGDVAYDRTRFVWVRYEAGWRTYPRTTGTQYGDALLQHEAGPLTRLAAVPEGTGQLGNLPADFAAPTAQPEETRNA
jgi:hypothetical protein